MILYFTYESRDALNSFILFITAKTIRKLNLGHNDKFQNKNLEKLDVGFHVLQTMQNLVISRCCFAENSREMYQDLQRTCTAIVLHIKPFVFRCRGRHGFLKLPNDKHATRNRETVLYSFRGLIFRDWFSRKQLQTDVSLNYSLVVFLLLLSDLPGICR